MRMAYTGYFILSWPKFIKCIEFNHNKWNHLLENYQNPKYILEIFQFQYSKYYSMLDKACELIKKKYLFRYSPYVHTFKGINIKLDCFFIIFCGNGDNHYLEEIKMIILLRRTIWIREIIFQKKTFLCRF